MTKQRRASDRAHLRRVWIRRGVWVAVVGAAVALGTTSTRWAASETVRDGAPSWSPDGRRLAFATEGTDGQSDIYVMNADGTGRRQLTRSPGDDTAPAFSPDGRTIAFETNRDGNYDIYVMDADGANPRRLTTDPASDRAPAWSPDGRSIVFTSERDVRRQPDVYLMKPDGTGLTQLTSRVSNWSPSFSPDGKRLALQVDKDIYVMDLATHDLHRVTFDPDNGMSPTWSPDGTRLAFVSNRRGRLELFQTDLDGAHQQLLASIASGAAIDPRWSPDGSRVAFVSVPDSPPNSRNKEQEYAIYTIEVASGKIDRISQ
jgi:Tol biopolymer transport system component